MSSRPVEADMAAYYARRADEYERIYHKPERQADLRALERRLGGDLFAGRSVLEIACGTGWWTAGAAAASRRWLATDLSPETMAVARRKPMPPQVRFATVDAYTLDGIDVEGPCDAAFAGCWWSHVPLARLPGWLALLHGRLPRGARVVFIDNRYVEGNSTPLARRDADGNGYQLRRLDDGSTHEVLKNYPQRDEALAMLGPRAHAAQWIAHAHYWLLTYELN